MKRLRMQLQEAPAFTVRSRSEKRRLIPAIAGDVAHFNGERHVTRVRCAEHSPRGYVCITHAQLLANQYQLQEHVRGTIGTQHVVAAVCAHHGAEELEL